MKKKTLIFYCSILLMFCQVMMITPGAVAISKVQEDAISKNCESIKESLKNVQRSDSKTRVYLGSYYETILTKYITPLNVRLVENNLSNAELVENQNDFATAKTTFANDFTKYQQLLEELIAVDCKNRPAEFYEKLDVVRQRRKTMEQDVLELRSLISKHVKLINGLKGKL